MMVYAEWENHLNFCMVVSIDQINSNRYDLYFFGPIIEKSNRKSEEMDEDLCYQDSKTKRCVSVETFWIIEI